MKSQVRHRDELSEHSTAQQPAESDSDATSSALFSDSSPPVAAALPHWEHLHASIKH